MNIFWNDSLNFISKLTPRRAWNFAKVLSSFYLTKILRRPIQWGMPVTVSIEPTTACNLRCPECPSGLRAFSRDTGNLKEDFFRKTVEELHRDLFYLIFYFQGEPYINPKFLDMVNHAHQRKIFTITSTNGHFLNDENARRTVESGLDRLIISVDGTTQETYEQYRVGGSLDNAIVLGETSVLNALRFDDEFVRHKILDVLGDLALVGYPIIGHLVAHRGGHALHTSFAARILEEADAWRLVESQMEPALAGRPVLVPAKNRVALNSQ